MELLGPYLCVGREAEPLGSSGSGGEDRGEGDCVAFVDGEPLGIIGGEGDRSCIISEYELGGEDDCMANGNIGESACEVMWLDVRVVWLLVAVAVNMPSFSYIVCHLLIYCYNCLLLFPLSFGGRHRIVFSRA